MFRTCERINVFHFLFKLLDAIGQLDVSGAFRVDSLLEISIFASVFLLQVFQMVQLILEANNLIFKLNNFAFAIN